jgi:SulP family sulfate permease
LGDSKIRVSSPNIIFVAVASTIVSREGVLGLSFSTLLAGVLLMGFGALRFGAAIRALPRAVVLGFSTGMAVLVVSQQVHPLAGIDSQILAPQVPWGVPRLLRDVIAIHPTSIILALATLMMIVVSRKAISHFPTGLLAMTLGALLVKYGHIPGRTIADFYNSHLNLFTLYAHGPFRLGLLWNVLGQALALAVLVATESLQALGLASAFTGEEINPNGELFIHGGVNIAAALAGGLPASGISSFTSENARVGAQTPLAGIMQAAFLLFLLVLLAPLFPFIPIAVISGIVLASVCSMARWPDISQLIRGPRLELGGWLATFLLTVAAELPVAIAVGMLIALFLYGREAGTPV